MTSSTAFITGATQGMGREFCRQLARRGHQIVALSADVSALDTLVDELQAHTNVVAIEADIASDIGQTRALEALRQHGPLRYLINAATIEDMLPIDGSDAAWQNAWLRLQVDAPVALCRTATAFMRQETAGTVVNVIAAGQLPDGSHGAVLSASAAFMREFSERLREDVADAGIDVVCVSGDVVDDDLEGAKMVELVNKCLA